MLRCKSKNASVFLLFCSFLTFNLGAQGKTNAKKLGAVTPPPACTGNNCFVTIQNNCGYDIYAFYSDSTMESVPLGNTNNNIIPANQSKAFIPLSTYTTWNSNSKIFFTAGPDANCKNDRTKCIVGARGTSTLFEFNKNTPGLVVYDISLVDGFDFPMTVQISNLSDCKTDPNRRDFCVPQPQYCGPIHTGTLEVSQCTAYQSLAYKSLTDNKISGCSENATQYCARWAEYAGDTGPNKVDVALDCLSVPSPSGNPIGCSAPNKFGTSLQNAQKSSSCSQLPAWMKNWDAISAWNSWGCNDELKCVAQPKPADCVNNSKCENGRYVLEDLYLQESGLPHARDRTVVSTLPHQTSPNAVNTEYYNWVKLNTFYGSRDALGDKPPTNMRVGGVYAFAKDDRYSQYITGSAQTQWVCNFGATPPNTPEQLCLGNVTNTCQGQKESDGKSFADKLKFKIIIGPQQTQDYSAATGACPRLP